jgi:S-disulfanyl-L-cysteine oxidoreductase SoxD
MRRYLIVLFAATFGLAAGLAQVPTSVLDAVYTAEQAARGEAAYGAHCIECHEGLEADGPELAGKAFVDRWREDRLESLFTFIRTTMPGNTPGSLTDDEYADILAYLLRVNGLPAGARELRPDMVGSIQFVGPDGPQPLPNLTIVRAVGCFNAQANKTWALVAAGSPVPVRNRIVAGTTPEELERSAAQPLGTRTFPLLSVTQQHAESYGGHKVQVTGVLNRRITVEQTTVERINVMSIESVAPTCGSQTKPA